MEQKRSTSVYQLKNGNWGYRLSITINGEKVSQRRTKTAEGLPFKTKHQAMKARESAIKELQANALMPTQKQPVKRMRIREVYEEYCSVGRKEKAYSTIKKQEALWNNHILKRFGSTYLDNVRVADIQDFLAELYCVKGYSYAYVEGFLKQFYLIFGQAYSRNYLPVNEYNKLCVNKNTKIKMPAKRSVDVMDVVAYSDDELQQLDEYFKGTAVETGYMIGRYSGLRISEAYGITWDSINFEEGYISVERQLQTNGGLVRLASLKTVNARRKVYMCDTLKEYLLHLQERTEQYKKEYVRQRKQNEIMVYDDVEGEVSSLNLINTLPNGRLQTAHAIRHHARAIMDRYGIHFKYHNLRHTYGTKMALMNTPEHILLNQMGHSKSSTTHKYYLAMSEEGIAELKNNVNKL